MLGLVLAVLLQANGQGAPTTTQAAPPDVLTNIPVSKDLLALQNERLALSFQLTQLQNQHDALAAELSDRRDYDATQLDLHKARAANDAAKITNDERLLKYMESRRTWTAANTEAALRDKLGTLEATMMETQRKLRTVESNLTRLTDIEIVRQDFKSRVSLYFAILVALVIIAFFLAALDPKIRHRVFSPQSAIQFVTLFSLVIAIILFGILGILESRELSALLGGLSGYILGRVTSAREQNDKQQPSDAA
jgi:hypothetical protein